MKSVLLTWIYNIFCSSVDLFVGGETEIMSVADWADLYHQHLLVTAPVIISRWSQAEPGWARLTIIFNLKQHEQPQLILTSQTSLYHLIWWQQLVPTYLWYLLFCRIRIFLCTWSKSLSGPWKFPVFNIWRKEHFAGNISTFWS